MSFGAALSLTEQRANNPQAAINAASWESAVAIPKVKAVYIDVVENTITDIEIEPTLSEYYRLLRCSTIEAVRWAFPDNDLYIDEEGLLKEITCFFTIGPHQFAGSALVVGPPDEDGGETSTTLTADEVRKVVKIYQIEREVHS